jgi:hypothetical protein
MGTAKHGRCRRGVRALLSNSLGSLEVKMLPYSEIGVFKPSTHIYFTKISLFSIDTLLLKDLQTALSKNSCPRFARMGNAVG